MPVPMNGAIAASEISRPPYRTASDRASLGARTIGAVLWNVIVCYPGGIRKGEHDLPGLVADRQVVHGAVWQGDS